MRAVALGLFLAALGLVLAACQGQTESPSTSRPSGGQADRTVPASTGHCPPRPGPGERATGRSLSIDFGLNGGANAFDPCIARRLGARIVRVEFGLGTPVSRMRAHVAAYADRGMRVLLLASFHDMPSSGQARSVAGWAREFGPRGRFWEGRSDGDLAVRHIEFGNETSYAYQGTERRGGEYAQRVRDSSRALRGPAGNRRVGLLVQADDGGTGAGWVDQMYDAVPELHRYVAGWTVHPYGPRERWQPRIDELVARTADRGAPDSIPIDVTEWGLASDQGRCLTDNYGWDPCMSPGEAAEALQTTVREMTEYLDGRLRQFIIYTGRDQRPSGTGEDREYYFGALTVAETPKGTYTTAIRALLSAPGKSD